MLSDPAFVAVQKNAEGSRAKLRIGDLLISITAELGVVAIADERCEGGYVNQHLALVRLSQARCDGRYVAYALDSPDCKEQFKILGYGGTKQGLSLSDVGEIVIRLPSLERQIEIRRWLDQRAAFLACVEKKVKASIDCLKERRALLITAAVAGQIDVACSTRGETDRRLGRIEEESSLQEARA